MMTVRTAIKRILGRPPQAKPKELDVRNAYRLWAPTYENETATSALDEQLAQEMLGKFSPARLLDAGCGIGRRIQNIPNAVGLDLSPEMLAVGRGRNVVEGDIRQMPFPAEQFDMIWSRLVLGHLPDPIRAYREFYRVCTPGGFVFVTDFHPDAVLAGHQRTLTDSRGTIYSIEHYVHHQHVDLAEQAGLVLVERRFGVVGPSIREFYEAGIGLKAYKRDLGLKIVDAMLFHKPLNDSATQPGQTLG